MANSNNPNGFTPAYHLTGGTIRMNEMRIADDYATSIFAGDLVSQAADGTIAVAGEGDQPIGVFAGCSYTKDSGEVVFSSHWAASTSVNGSYATANVYSDPNIAYRAQFEGASGIADIGQLADMETTHAGSTLNGRSGQEISSTTGAATATLRILDFVDSPDNDSESDNAEAYVQIVEHKLSEAPVATGV